jgi:hypothetical protein
LFWQHGRKNRLLLHTPTDAAIDNVPTNLDHRPLEHTSTNAAHAERLSTAQGAQADRLSPFLY